MRCLCIALLLWAGCAKQDDDDEFMIEGTINVPDYAMSGEVEGVKAFGYEEGGRMIAYVSSNAKATCASVSEFLNPEPGQRRSPPAKVLKGRHCNIFILIDGGWEGGFDSHWPDESSVYSDALSSNVRCDMGAGDWVYESRGSGYEDWYWTGTTWSGVPDHYNWSFSGGDGRALKLDIRMTTYQGSFPSEAIYEVIPATGQVEGVVTAQWCPALANATIF